MSLVVMATPNIPARKHRPMMEYLLDSMPGITPMDNLLMIDVEVLYLPKPQRRRFAYIQGCKCQDLDALDHLADDDATVVFATTTSDHGRTVEQTRDARIPQMTGVVGSVRERQHSPDRLARLSGYRLVTAGHGMDYLGATGYVQGVHHQSAASLKKSGGGISIS